MAENKAAKDGSKVPTNRDGTIKSFAETPLPETMNMSETQAKEWGYDLYPDRRNTHTGVADYVFGVKHKDNILQYKCEKKLVELIKTSTIPFSAVPFLFECRQ